MGSELINYGYWKFPNAIKYLRPGIVRNKEGVFQLICGGP